MSRTIVAGRRTGKTLRCICESAITGRVILVVNDNHKKAMMDTAKSLELEMPEPVTLQEWKDGKGRGSDVYRNGVIVDEGKWLLEQVLHTHIHLMTIGENEEK